MPEGPMAPKIIIATTEITTGGLGSYLRSLIDGLGDRGWEVHLLVANTQGDHFSEVSKNIRCHDLSGVPLSPKKVFMAAEIADGIDPDVILLNNCALMHYALPLVNHTTKAVAVLHSDDPRFYAIGSLFPRYLFRWVAPTPGVRNRFQPFLKKNLREKVRVIPHGVDGGKFYRTTSPKEQTMQVLFVGFLGESKGADVLPGIFQKVAGEVPGATLNIVGKGPLESALKEEFRKRGLQERVSFHGPKSRDETAALMRSSDILLLPTRLEGFGIAIVEAMMCGVVPVVSRLEGITDQLVEDGKSGILVSPGDVDGFSDAIKHLSHDRKTLGELSARASSFAADRFSLNTMLDRYESLFAEPVEGKLPRRSRPAWYAEAAVQYLRKRLR